MNNGSWIEYKGCFEDGECVFFQDDFNAQAIGTNGIETTRKNASNSIDDAIFDLQGRRLKTALEKGVYIRDGKKYIQR